MIRNVSYDPNEVNEKIQTAHEFPKLGPLAVCCGGVPKTLPARPLSGLPQFDAQKVLRTRPL